MSNEITITNDLTFNRVAKSGKVTTRGTLGVLMSGNRSESSALSRIAAKALIANNTFGPVMVEVSRVFPASTLLKCGIFELGGTKGDYATYDSKTKVITVLDGKWNAAAAHEYCKAVLVRCEALENAGKELKGEKSLAHEFAEEVVRHIKSKEAAKAAELAAA